MDSENKKNDYMERAEKMLDRLIKAVTDEKDDVVTVLIIMYATTRFTASLLLGMQEETLDMKLVENFNNRVKELMAARGEDLRLQPIKDKIAENERIMDEAVKKLKEKEKRIMSYEEEYMLKMKYRDSDEVN